MIHLDISLLNSCMPYIIEELNKLKLPIKIYTGKETKEIRTKYNLPKDHYIDARCISGNPLVKPLGYIYYQKKVRCHNRQIHKNTILKGGYRKRNQAPYEVMGFRLFDKVKYQGNDYFIFGRRSSGFFNIRTLDGTKVNKGSLSYKKITFLETSQSFLTEQRKVMA